MGPLGTVTGELGAMGGTFHLLLRLRQCAGMLFGSSHILITSNSHLSECREAWCAVTHGVTKSRTRLRD